jgi:hypothetical protein
MSILLRTVLAYKGSAEVADLQQARKKERPEERKLGATQV